MPNIPYDPSHPAVYQPELRESLFHAGAPGGDVALATEAARLAYIRFEESPAQAQRLRVALAAAGFDATMRRPTARRSAPCAPTAWRCWCFAARSPTSVPTC